MKQSFWLSFVMTAEMISLTCHHLRGSCFCRKFDSVEGRKQERLHEPLTFLELHRAAREERCSTYAIRDSGNRGCCTRSHLPIIMCICQRRRQRHICCHFFSLQIRMASDLRSDSRRLTSAFYHVQYRSSEKHEVKWWIHDDMLRSGGHTLLPHHLVVEELDVDHEFPPT